MINKKFGSTFRLIREQNHFSLTKFSSINISKSALSKFERGESMMNFENVYKSLDIMGVSLEDYENILNNYSPIESEYLIEEIEYATTTINLERLGELQRIAENKGYIFIAISAKCSLQSLNSVEQELITDYFFELNIWSYKELCILYLVMGELRTHDILYLLDIFLVKGHSLLNSKKSRSYLVQACCKAVTLLAQRGFYEYSKHILNEMDSQNLVNSMFLRNVRNITYGYWVFSFENQKIGDGLMRDALGIFNAVSTPEIANYYQKQYEKYINYKEK